MKASILAIGTELVQGEVINSNAAWISQQLQQLSISIGLHVTVTDDENDIIRGLKICEEQTDLIFLVGGLGPTSDDLTRYVLAEHLQKPMVFDQDYFLLLKERYKKMGRSLKASHRSQCEYPKGSYIYDNKIGTAKGFRQHKKAKDYICLPGPPKELASVWLNGVNEFLKSKNINPTENLYRWTCFGAGESEIAEIVEEVMAESGFTLGYRASVPYVHVKVWVPQSLEGTKEKFFSVLESRLSQCLISFDPAEKLLNLCQQKKLKIFDRATGGKLLQRLMQAKNYSATKAHFEYLLNAPVNVKEGYIALAPVDKQSWSLEVCSDSIKFKKTIRSIFNLSLKSERAQDFMIEEALFLLV